ncbi:UbiD family decarboxylase [Chloroflexota bacterium]
MVFKDFREYLEALEKEELLLKVKKEVAPRFDIPAGIRKISDNNGPALLFENVKGYPGWRVAGGLFGTRRLTAFALQTEDDEEKIVERYLNFDYNQRAVKPVLVSSGMVKDIIIKGDDIDLTKLPVPTFGEQDSTPYLTAGVEIGIHPKTGVQSASIHRRAVLGKDKTSIWVQPLSHLGLMIREAEAQGQGLGVATVIGVHPALAISSQIKVIKGIEDKMAIAGAFRGAPFELIKCETIDCQVPADAEIVIEGVIIPRERVADGPFAEYPGDYATLSSWIGSLGDFKGAANVVQVTAITMRKDAIFQTMLAGAPLTENHYLKKWTHAAIIRRILSRLVPSPEDIHGVNLTAGGAAEHHIVVGIHKRSEATAREIIYAILSMSTMSGLVIVVDDDIDIYDPVAVDWAIATRVRPNTDVIILPTVGPPAAAPANISTHVHKWGIDATAPLTKEPWLYKRAVPPGLDKVDYV